MYSATTVRERVLAREMAEQLRISLRAFANLKKLGIPYCQVGGTTWYEPVVVHKWLDQFNRHGTPGKRYHRTPAVLEPKQKARSPVES
jgi:hypothetical protein